MSGRPTVFVVEDNEDLRSTIVDVIEDAGFTVETATNGREALAWLQRTDRQPCMILLDLMMPEVSGYDVIRILRETDRLFTLPVAVMSAVPAPELPQGIRVIKKPMNIEDILAAVESCCGAPE